MAAGGSRLCSSRKMRLKADFEGARLYACVNWLTQVRGTGTGLPFVEIFAGRLKRKNKRKRPQRNLVILLGRSGEVEVPQLVRSVRLGLEGLTQMGRTSADHCLRERSTGPLGRAHPVGPSADWLS